MLLLLAPLLTLAGVIFFLVVFFFGITIILLVKLYGKPTRNGVLMSAVFSIFGVVIFSIILGLIVLIINLAVAYFNV